MWRLPISADVNCRGRATGRNSSAATAPSIVPRLSGGAAPLSNRVGGGLDPCGALQTRIEIAPNSTTEIVFFLGEAATKEEALALIAHYRAANLDAVLTTVTREWDDVLGAVQVTTPDRAMDVLLNRWLLYQTLACRVWARAAFYQASGAYGFRDQLQDVMALGVSRPQITREHLLRAAARQFVEGDVQHWWLPPSGQGVRTRISDDRAWLPYVTAHYIEATGDDGVLDEMVAFLDGPALKADEHESFFQPTISSERGSLFEHCARALDSSLAVGTHGLPLIGTGDWNDGLSRVGIGGKGESDLARLVPSRHALGLRAAGGSPRRADARHELAAARRRAGTIPRAGRMGRRLVSPRVFRRWHAARGRSRATNVASTPSRSRGRSCRAPEHAAAR